MPIVYLPTSVKKTQAFQVGLAQLAQLKRIPAGLTIKPPLAVYNVGVRELMMSSSFDAAGTLVTWRYFATGDSSAVASGDIDLSPNPKLTSLAYGEQVAEALSALTSAESDPVLSDINFEPRLLRIHGLLTECLWLSPMLPPGTADGWAVPYHTAINTLDRAKRYAASELFQILQSLAAQSLDKSRLPPQKGRPAQLD